MFEEVLGLPVHVLVVHAVVIFVPLLVLLAIAYVALPRFRPRLDWAVAVMAVAAPVAAWVAVESGEVLADQLVARGFSGEILDKILQHSRYGELLLWWTVPLAVAAALLLVVTRGHPRVPKSPRWAAPALSVAVIALGIIAIIYVYLTGHSGAEAVWGGTF